MNTADASRLAQAAMQAWAAGDAANAERLAHQCVALSPNDPNALQMLSAVALRAGRVEEAVAHLRAADAAAPNQPAIVNALGQALKIARDFQAARAAFERAAALGVADAWRSIGEIDTETGDFSAALASFEKAVSVAPNSAPAHAALARALERRHELARAKTHAERTLALNASSQTARLAFAQIALRERDFASVHDVLAPVLSSGTPTNRALAYGFVGEACDREGRANEAFAAFTAANQLLLQTYGHYLDATFSPYHPNTITRLSAFVDRAEPARWPRAASLAKPAPVFLVGFPRSGTTLLDQVLASHSQIVGLEEKDLFSAAVLDLLESDATMDAVASLSGADIASRRARYWQAAQAVLREPLGDRVLVDKLPLNIVFLPLIVRIFPDAKIIVALRDPRDVNLSCYQQRFGMNPAMAQLLQLDTAARYYDAVMNLFEKARAKFAVALHVVRYEDTVADLESVARGLASFLGVPFEPAMLDFAATAKRRDINTPSARQVVEPLYSRSVGRWRAYAEHLAPIMPTLQRWAVHFGYEGRDGSA